MTAHDISRLEEMLDRVERLEAASVRPSTPEAWLDYQRKRRRDFENEIASGMKSARPRPYYLK